ncbi:aldose 1-epimerase [Mycolicibacterium komossense]|uniref:Aldose 1-epimerase n=1 Tax=Mycolicibacterium komossense TaxID=1779 RepID=A0ABT3CKK8_9MYCO|nr:aldose 1-epimerase [Mycolicibacterium komossense]MCV7230038.1 aldose 1-epimerase [Mycolicibacterium komossense]
MSAYPTVTLQDPSSSMTATYVPGAGMICTSLAEDGVEYLGQRRGLDAYVSNGKTMGIPILYPWANRLSANNYDVDGAVVTLTAGAGGVRTDGHGAPMHGVLAAYPGWVVTAQSGNQVTAALDFGGTPQLLAAFPFPHVLVLTASLADRTLTVETTVRPTTAAAVPLCFGFHPYVQLPGVPRQEWQLESPAMRHLPVDEFGLPTGATAEWAGGAQILAETELDDGFDQVPDGAVFAISAGGRRVAVTFANGYPAAQIFAPGGDDLIGLEPMAAPTDALRRGAYRVAAPGKPETATFSIRVG